MPQEHYKKGPVKFLIKDGGLLINDLSFVQAPSHAAIASLAGLISKSVAIQIISAEDDARPALMNMHIGTAVLGGLCNMISDDPPKYEYLSGSSTVPPADEEQFNEVQKNGPIKFIRFERSDFRL